MLKNSISKKARAGGHVVHDAWEFIGSTRHSFGPWKVLTALLALASTGKGRLELDDTSFISPPFLPSLVNSLIIEWDAESPMTLIYWPSKVGSRRYIAANNAYPPLSITTTKTTWAHQNFPPLVPQPYQSSRLHSSPWFSKTLTSTRSTHIFVQQDWTVPAFSNLMGTFKVLKNNDPVSPVVGMPTKLWEMAHGFG